MFLRQEKDSGSDLNHEKEVMQTANDGILGDS